MQDKLIKNCVIVVDAWKKCLIEDTKKFSFWQKECDAFSKYLQVQLCQIKNKFSYNIFHLSCSPISSYINLFDGNIYDDYDKWANNLILKGYNNIFFCGFHLDACVSKNYKFFLKKSKNTSINAAIVHNLSIVKPNGTFANAKYKYVYYTHSLGFTPLTIHFTT